MCIFLFWPEAAFQKVVSCQPAIVQLSCFVECVATITVLMQLVASQTKIHERFQVQHVPGTEEWRLVLQPVQKTDHGWYSCQVRPIYDSREWAQSQR